MPKDNNLHNYHCKNLKSHVSIQVYNTLNEKLNIVMNHISNWFENNHLVLNLVTFT
jgi:hypothetical protein